ncbi:MAG: MarR family winged helix-turn-helix transcriptional regulator [Pseudomonadota bacterium]
MIDKKDDAFLETNLKGLMMTLVGRWNTQMDEARAQTEFGSVRPSDIRVFSELRGRTLKLSEIHKDLGFSRQAAQQSVDRLVAHGMLRVELTEGSKRDKRVVITEKGQAWRSHAARLIQGFEAECMRVVGPQDTQTLRRILAALIDGEPID